MMEDGLRSFPPVQDPGDLQPRYEELRQIMEQNQRVFDAVEEALGRVALQFYPDMKEWSPEQLHNLASLIAQQAARFSCGISELYDEKKRTPITPAGTTTIVQKPRFPAPPPTSTHPATRTSAPR
jgi:hypothetical protein